MGKTNEIINSILDSCPYCKGKAKIKKATTTFCNHTVDQYYVECSGCGASTDAFNTYFALVQQGKSQVLTEKGAVEHAISDWNDHTFNVRTRLSHMSYKEKIIWQIKRLLSIVVHGGMYSTDSIEHVNGWKIREIAEHKGILKMHSDNLNDLGEISKELFNDREVRSIIFKYLEEKDKWNIGQEEIEEWCGYFNQFFDGEENLTASIRNRISELLEKI